MEPIGLFFPILMNVNNTKRKNLIYNLEFH